MKKPTTLFVLLLLASLTYGCGSALDIFNNNEDDKAPSPAAPQVTAAFTYSPSDPLVDENVAFTDASLGTIETLQWSFERGFPSTSLEKNPQAKWDTPGSFDVILRVCGPGGHCDSWIETVEVTEVE